MNVRDVIALGYRFNLHIDLYIDFFLFHLLKSQNQVLNHFCFLTLNNHTCIPQFFTPPTLFFALFMPDKEGSLSHRIPDPN